MTSDTGEQLALFLSVYGFIFLTFVYTCFSEHRRRRDTILLLRPWPVFLSIVTTMAWFYLSYILMIYTLDVCFRIKFFWTQFWSQAAFRVELSSTSGPRQDVNVLALIISLGSCAIPLSALVERSYDVLDYNITVAIIHLTVVCIENGSFPVYGSFWLGFVLGVFIQVVLSHLLVLQLERMDWKSKMGREKGPKKKQKAATAPASAFDALDVLVSRLENGLSTAAFQPQPQQPTSAVISAAVSSETANPTVVPTADAEGERQEEQDQHPSDADEQLSRKHSLPKLSPEVLLASDIPGGPMPPHPQIDTPAETPISAQQQEQEQPDAALPADSRLDDTS